MLRGLYIQIAWGMSGLLRIPSSAPQLSKVNFYVFSKFLFRFGSKMYESYLLLNQEGALWPREFPFLALRHRQYSFYQPDLFSARQRHISFTLICFMLPSAGGYWSSTTLLFHMFKNKTNLKSNNY